MAMNNEGIATLVQLSRLYQCFPGMILTIQSGVIETHGSIFSRLLEQLIPDTPYWVRGFWRRNLLGTKIEDIMSEPYGQLVQTYGYWYSAMGQKHLENEENKTKYYPNSIVKAYARKLPEVTDIYELFHPMNARRRARILKCNVWDEDLTRYDALFT